MISHDNNEDIEVIESLEPIEEETEGQKYHFLDSISSYPIIQELLNKYTRSLLPIVLMDENMMIHWASMGFLGSYEVKEIPVRLQNMFKIDKELPWNQNFPQHLNMQSTNGYFKAQLTRYRKKSNSIQSLITVFPLYDKKDRAIFAYMGILNDTTDEHQYYIKKTFIGLLEASKLKDDDTGHHIERVNRYSLLLAQRLFGREGYEEITPDFLNEIGFLAAMHDVGKIGTPDNILNKRGSLDDKEWEIMREHTINGAIILSSYPGTMAKEIARSHHEKWDGSGYPYGLMGTDIPLAARIVTIADVYDALRSKRSYKDAYDHKRAINIMIENSGTHFDPDLLKVFLEIHKEFEKTYTELVG
ncbi:HD-GYP domain-containing protein [Spirochaeta cellobiosiphila]|uniref:HD-GYP domain-containing protein n=1 Tax=Spirochaeta cellobiosiphila TaxID=504483 RepID=UPI0003FD2BDF|nr:HD-GYP domain-containing protein [Spirochaeta cellobiosiphila]